MSMTARLDAPASGAPAAPGPGPVRMGPDLGDARPTSVILRALGLGDLLTALPALRALDDALPEYRRVLLAPTPLAPLVRHAGVADEVVPQSGLGSLPPALHGADIAVNLHGRGPESHRLLLAGAPRRLIAFAHPGVPESSGAPAWSQAQLTRVRSDHTGAGPPEEHEVARWCRLLTESGIDADPCRLAISRPDCPVPPWSLGATVLHPGAGTESRRWPVACFAELARAERAAGREVVVTGGQAERHRAGAVAEAGGLDPTRVLAGRTDVLELAAVIASAARVVVGDTGVAHLATALGTPSVVLFGPTSPREWGPPPDRPQHIVLWTGRTGDPHAERVDPGLAAITVDRVLDALRRLPPARPPATVAAGHGER